MPFDIHLLLKFTLLFTQQNFNNFNFLTKQWEPYQSGVSVVSDTELIFAVGKRKQLHTCTHNQNETNRHTCTHNQTHKCAHVAT